MRLSDSVRLISLAWQELTDGEMLDVRDRDDFFQQAKGGDRIVEGIVPSFVRAESIDLRLES